MPGHDAARPSHSIARRRAPTAPARSQRAGAPAARASRRSASVALSADEHLASTSAGVDGAAQLGLDRRQRAASSGGNAAGRTLMPKPSTTCCTPSARSTPRRGCRRACARRNPAPPTDDDVVRPLDLHRQAGGARDASATATPPASVSHGASDARRMTTETIEPGTGRREPLAAETAAARRLRASDERRPFRRAALGRAPPRGRWSSRLPRRRTAGCRTRRARPRSRRAPPRNRRRAATELARDRITDAPVSDPWIAAVTLASRLELEAEIRGRRRVRQRADRHVVGAGLRQLGNPLERHAAGDLDLRAAARSRRTASRDRVDRQVVERG